MKTIKELEKEIEETENIINKVFTKIKIDLTPFAYKLIKRELEKDLKVEKAILKQTNEIIKMIKEDIKFRKPLGLEVSEAQITVLEELLSRIGGRK